MLLLGVCMCVRIQLATHDAAGVCISTTYYTAVAENSKENKQLRQEGAYKFTALSR